MKGKITQGRNLPANAGMSQPSDGKMNPSKAVYKLARQETGNARNKNIKLYGGSSRKHFDRPEDRPTLSTPNVKTSAGL